VSFEIDGDGDGSSSLVTGAFVDQCKRDNIGCANKFLNGFPEIGGTFEIYYNKHDPSEVKENVAYNKGELAATIIPGIIVFIIFIASIFIGTKNCRKSVSESRAKRSRKQVSRDREKRSNAESTKRNKKIKESELESKPKLYDEKEYVRTTTTAPPHPPDRNPDYRYSSTHKYEEEDEPFPSGYVPDHDYNYKKNGMELSHYDTGTDANL
jgi:hypothetical protein